MLQHEESDEDDYEGYFLRPVNGYKIADRIISANKELFEEPTVVSSDSTDGNQRRVTFREDLEDFEPDFSSEENYEDSDIIDDDLLDEIENDSVPVEPENCSINNGLNAINEGEPKFNQSIEMQINDNCAESIEEICEEIEEVILDRKTECLNRLDTKTSTFQTDESCDSTVIECIVNKQHPQEDNHTVSNKSKSNHEPFNLNQNPSIPSTSSFVSQPKLLRKISNPKILKMQLNLKPCCEYKLMESSRLPRYSGYYSQYGLSKEQIEQREMRQHQLHRRRHERNAKKHEENLTKSQMNEDAFSRWLQNKIKHPRNLTKNMYDYKPSRQHRRFKKNS